MGSRYYCVHFETGVGFGNFLVLILNCGTMLHLCQKLQNRSGGVRRTKVVKIWEKEGSSSQRYCSLSCAKLQGMIRPTSTVPYLSTTGHLWFLRWFPWILVSFHFKAFFIKRNHCLYLIHGKQQL